MGQTKIRAIIILVVWLLPVGSTFTSGERTPVYARKGMVVSSSAIASSIGRDIMKQGGTAIDATVATAFALAVTWPAAGNIGGGGFLVYMDNKSEVTTFDFREKAPLSSDKGMFMDEQGQVRANSNHDGLLAVGVPGTVAGLFLAHAKNGKLPWAQLVEPAVILAREGFPLPWSIYNDFDSALGDKISQYPSTQLKAFKPDGTRYQPGDIWTQPDLAETLIRIRDHGQDGFYRGKTAKRLAAFMKSNGGIITQEDLDAYRAVERTPLKGTYRGYEIYSMPPPSSGGVALIEMLNVLEGYDLNEVGYHSAQYLHLFAESMRRAFADRARYVGDPDYNPEMPIDRLISKERGTEARNQINWDHASTSELGEQGLPREGENTTHFSVYDPYGNAVSMTYTLEYSYGSGIVAEGLGFFLNNEMGDFNPVPGVTNDQGQIGTRPNLVEPGKRMLSSMTPTIVARNGQPMLIIGSPGGRTIINTVLQVIVNVVDHHMNIATAIDAGRIHHQWFPDQIQVEPWILSPDTRAILEKMGHKVVTSGRVQGRAMGILVDPIEGLITGAADSRSPEGGAAGY